MSVGPAARGAVCFGAQIALVMLGVTLGACVVALAAGIF